MAKLTAFLMFVAASFMVSAQVSSFISNTSISLGFAVQPQDRRIFDFPDWVLENETTEHDFEYSLLFNKAIIEKNRWATYFIGGYSINHETFGRPFNHPYFTGRPTKELRVIEHYLTHNLNLGINPRFTIAERNSSSFYLQAPLLAKIAIKKHINDNWNFGTNKKFNKWLFEPNNMELYLGLGCRLKKVEIGLAYRMLNLQHKDPVLFYPSLFNTANPEFLQTKYEWNNLTKIWLTASYQLCEVE
jgi:hypothetical protein